MERIYKSLIVSVGLLVVSVHLSAQTKFAYGIDTLFVSGKDGRTVVDGRGYVFNVGDTVSVNYWCASDDSLFWFALYDSNNGIMFNDSVMVDTLPLYKYYCAVLNTGYKVEYIVWKVANVAYRVLSPPALTNDANVLKSDILLLRYDTLRLFASFAGLQPDSVFWYRDGFRTSLPVTTKGTYMAKGFIYNRHGDVIDASASEAVAVDFEYPLSYMIFKSWRGSNDGLPRQIDTLRVDTCVREVIMDTLVFAVGDAYKYQFVPVIRSFDRVYNFTYKWEYAGFAFVQTIDSVLEFNPLRFEHTGSYVFVTSWKSGALTTVFRSQPVRIVAYNTGNYSIKNEELRIKSGDVYSVSGALVRADVSGYYPDVIRGLQLPSGVYFLRTKDGTFKFVK